MKFSACWITKNESKNIKRSIDSLKDIVEEIIVVDTGSTDDTVDVAKAAGARVEFFEWIGDFSAARNYAMSLASGDIIFFLDADEWFSPALTAKDGDDIIGIFRDNPKFYAIQIQIKNLNDQGAIKTISAGNRIILNNRGLRFNKKVHEMVVLPSGASPDAYCTMRWPLDHTGYVEDMMREKMLRNIELLEDAAENSADPEERHLQHCYLVREYYQSGEVENSFRHFSMVLKEPDMIRRHCVALNHGFASFIYIMMLMASDPRVRSRICRKEIHKKLVEPFCKYIIGYPGIPTMELFYNATFDLKEDVILSQFSAAMEASKKMRVTPMTYYREAEMIINQRAATAALRRGKPTEAIEYAVESFKHTQNNNASAMHVLLSCMRGLPIEEIIYFLNSQFDLNNAQRLCFLSRSTCMYGFRDIHAYYLNKQIKANLATKADYLYLLVLYGKHSEAVSTALELYNEDIAGIVAEYLFLAAVCADDEKIFIDNKKYLTNHSNLLEVYFSGGILENPVNHEIQILIDDYAKIALAAGIERADKLRAIFHVKQPLLCFQVKAKYCVENGLYENVITESMPEENETLSNHYVVESLVAMGHCAEAFERIEKNFANGTVDDTLLRYLLTISDRSTGEQKSRAKSLYDKYIGPCDMFIDLQDTVNTGYITEVTDKKKQRVYKSLTYTQFNKQLAEEAGKPLMNRFPELCERAGALYTEKDMPATAMEYYRFAYAQGHNKAENKDRIISFFESVGNRQLAVELKKSL